MLSVVCLLPKTPVGGSISHHSHSTPADQYACRFGSPQRISRDLIVPGVKIPAMISRPVYHRRWELAGTVRSPAVSLNLRPAAVPGQLAGSKVTVFFGAFSKPMQYSALPVALAETFTSSYHDASVPRISAGRPSMTRQPAPSHVEDDGELLIARLCGDFCHQRIEIEIFFFPRSPFPPDGTTRRAEAKTVISGKNPEGKSSAASISQFLPGTLLWGLRHSSACGMAEHLCSARSKSREYQASIR